MDDTTKDKVLDIGKIQEYLNDFIKQREWNKFHSPKNLSMALSVEVAELLENFQWLTEEESYKIKENKIIFQNVKDEIGDVFCYLIQLASALDLDINKCFWEKTKKNELKHPPKIKNQ